MDFFAAQDRAVNSTRRFAVLFGLCVAGSILLVYFSLLAMVHFGLQWTDPRGFSQIPQLFNQRMVPPEFSLWSPRLFAGSIGGTLLIVGIAAWRRWREFSTGGAGVAELLAATRLHPDSTDPTARRVLNVVEEMAIAAGLPVPLVYELPHERGINALAAGLTPADAVIVITHGALQHLTRDELQGVIAHEFSHILNGDMRLNLRLAVLVHGIRSIASFGRAISYGKWSVSFGGGREAKTEASGLGLGVIVGLPLGLIGLGGSGFARVVQALVNRQREFLADASAVQFTRNPQAVASALKKVGGVGRDNYLTTKRSPEVGHFFFAPGRRSWFDWLWGTHPGLDRRIRAVEPGWDGNFFLVEGLGALAKRSGRKGPDLDPATVAFVTTATASTRSAASARADSPPDLPPELPPSPAEPPRLRVPVEFKPVEVVAQIGNVEATQLDQAGALLADVPPSLQEAARDSARTPALLCALLLDANEAVRAKQRDLITRHGDPALDGRVAALEASARQLDPAHYLPLVQIALSTLRALPAADLDRMQELLQSLISADDRVTTFEFSLLKLLRHQLALAARPSVRVDFHSFSSVTRDLTELLSQLAALGAADAHTAAAAFAAGAAQLPLVRDQLKFAPVERGGFARLDAALDRLAVCSPPIKQATLRACASVISHDRTVSTEEGELFRAVAAILGCPAPLPLLAKAG